MKILTIISAAFLIFGCAKETEYIYSEVEVSQNLEGLYYFEEVATSQPSGALELLVNYEGKVSARQVEEFTSKNFNDSYGTFPRISVSPTFQTDSGLILQSKDVNYNSNNDIEEDGSNTNITGKRYTVYKLFVDESGLLNLTIQIYSQASNSSGGINYLVVERKFREI